MAAITISDYLLQRVWTFGIAEIDFDRVKSLWNVEDKLLIGLQDKEIFKNRTRWSDLAPFHYRMLIIGHIQTNSYLSNDQVIDFSLQCNRSLTYLIAALIISIRERAETKIDYLRISRYAEFSASFDFNASLVTEIGMIPAAVPPVKPTPISPFFIVT